MRMITGEAGLDCFAALAHARLSTALGGAVAGASALAVDRAEIALARTIAQATLLAGGRRLRKGRHRQGHGSA